MVTPKHLSDEVYLYLSTTRLFSPFYDFVFYRPNSSVTERCVGGGEGCLFPGSAKEVCTYF